MQYRCDRCDSMVDANECDPDEDQDEDCEDRADGMVYADHKNASGERCDGSGQPVKTTNDGRVRRFEHFDRATLKAPVRMDNGFLKVEGRIARVGIQTYRDSKGGIRRELRLPEEVFNADSLASFQQVPVTNQHPPEMLTAKNAKKYTVGSVGESVRQDGDYVVAPLMLTDADAISAAEQGRSQLSNGYSCRLDDPDPSLVAKWGKHDSIQREIRGNHCAMVDIARAGPEARMRLDGADCESIQPGEFGVTESSMLASTMKTDRTQREQRETKMAHKITLDGMEFEVSDKNAQAIIERHVSAAQTKADAAAKETVELKKQLSEVQGKFDALDALRKADEDKLTDCLECDATGTVISGTKCINCDGQKRYPSKMDTAEHRKASVARMSMHGAQKRAALMVEAQRFLGANEKLDGLTDTEIKQAVLAKLAPALKFDAVKAEELSVRVDSSYATVLATSPKVSPVAQLRQVVASDLAPVVQTSREDDIYAPADSPEEARRRMNARMLEENKPARLKNRK